MVVYANSLRQNILLHDNKKVMPLTKSIYCWTLVILFGVGVAYFASNSFWVLRLTGAIFALVSVILMGQIKE